LPTSEAAPTTTEEVTEEPTSEVSETTEPTTEPTAQLTEEPTAASADGNNTNAALYVVIALLAFMLGGAVCLLKRKERTHNEKISSITPVAVNGGGNDTTDISD
jgi:uncharacterized protein HemX